MGVFFLPRVYVTTVPTGIVIANFLLYWSMWKVLRSLFLLALLLVLSYISIQNLLFRLLNTTSLPSAAFSNVNTVEDQSNQVLNI